MLWAPACLLQYKKSKEQTKGICAKIPLHFFNFISGYHTPKFESMTV